MHVSGNFIMVIVLHCRGDSIHVDVELVSARDDPKV
jgi:hypothetical protein